MCGRPHGLMPPEARARQAGSGQGALRHPEPRLRTAPNHRVGLPDTACGQVETRREAKR